MGPGKMSAEQKLLRQYATAMYAYTNAEVDSEEEKQAEAITDKLEAELLARLNAGGSLKDRISELLKLASGPENGPSEEAVVDAVKALLSRGASQPLQPKCPKCLGINLEMHFTDDGCQICYCRNPKCKHNAAPAEFFSAPPLSFDPSKCEVRSATMESCRKDKRSGCRTAVAPPATYLKQCVAEGTNCDCKDRCKFDVSASPASPQVAREIAAYVRGEFLKPLVCKPENDYLLDGLVPILQRHFPGSEGAQATRFEEFDDAEHPANKWWQKHGQFMMSGGGRRQFIWACRGWIAREQLLAGVEVTGDSLHEGAASPPVAASEAVQESNAARIAGVIAEAIHKTDPLYRKESTADAKAAPLTPRKETE